MLFAAAESSRKLNVYMEHPFSPILSAAMPVLNQIAAKSPTSLAFSPFINLEPPSAIRDCGVARAAESIKQINIIRTRIWRMGRRERLFDLTSCYWVCKNFYANQPSTPIEWGRLSFMPRTSQWDGRAQASERNWIKVCRIFCSYTK